MDGHATHEWRIGQLERRMERLEATLQRGLYLLVANLVGVVIALGKLLLFPGR
ncbi:MAG TPA: hypothetical protein VNJ53_07820 [Gaiellaceae bacterium]|nr:hypothetical protein [Gaiellaceae bacterium]